MRPTTGTTTRVVAPLVVLVVVVAAALEALPEPLDTAEVVTTLVVGSVDVLDTVEVVVRLLTNVEVAVA